MTPESFATSLYLIDFVSVADNKTIDVVAKWEEEYVKNGLSLRQISTKYIATRETVRKRLKEFGVELREHGQHHGRPAQVKYGHKIRNGKTESHLGEQRVVRAIWEMKEEGVSLRKIAKVLTNFKVPTKCRGKKWHPQMVKRILDRETGHSVNTKSSKEGLGKEADRIIRSGLN